MQIHKIKLSKNIIIYQLILSKSIYILHAEIINTYTVYEANLLNKVNKKAHKFLLMPIQIKIAASVVFPFAV